MGSFKLTSRSSESVFCCESFFTFLFSIFSVVNMGSKSVSFGLDNCQSSAWESVCSRRLDTHLGTVLLIFFSVPISLPKPHALDGRAEFSEMDGQ
jgi:hypothetical protein